MQHTLHTPFFARFSDWFEAVSYQRVKSVLRQRAAYNDTCKQLSSMSDRELWDIGISRGEIHSIALDHAKDLK